MVQRPPWDRLPNCLQRLRTGRWREGSALATASPDEIIRGHVSCSFLALVLKKELEDRIANMGKPAADSGAAQSGSWPDILADLDSLTETEVKQDGKRFLLRSAPRPAASLALRAAGVAPPLIVSTARRRPIPLHRSRECSAKAFSSGDWHMQSIGCRFQLLKISLTAICRRLAPRVCLSLGRRLAASGGLALSGSRGGCGLRRVLALRCHLAARVVQL